MLPLAAGNGTKLRRTLQCRVAAEVDGFYCTYIFTKFTLKSGVHDHFFHTFHGFTVLVHNCVTVPKKVNEL